MNSIPNNGPRMSEDGLFYEDASGQWVPVPKNVNPYPPQMYFPKSRSAYVILGLFLGCLGIHNFYAGRFGCAIAQLLITIFLGWLIVPLLAVAVWVIIECIVVTEDGRNVQFV